MRGRWQRDRQGNRQHRRARLLLRAKPDERRVLRRAQQGRRGHDTTLPEHRRRHDVGDELCGDTERWATGYGASTSSPRCAVAAVGGTGSFAAPSVFMPALAVDNNGWLGLAYYQSDPSDTLVQEVFRGRASVGGVEGPWQPAMVSGPQALTPLFVVPFDSTGTLDAKSTCGEDALPRRLPVDGRADPWPRRGQAALPRVGHLPACVDRLPADRRHDPAGGDAERGGLAMNWLRLGGGVVLSASATALLLARCGGEVDDGHGGLSEGGDSMRWRPRALLRAECVGYDAAAWFSRPSCTSSEDCASITPPGW